MYRCIVCTCTIAGYFSHMEDFLRERDESAYVDDDGNEQDVNNDAAASNNLNDDNGDTQATLVLWPHMQSASKMARPVRRRSRRQRKPGLMGR